MSGTSISVESVRKYLCPDDSGGANVTDRNVLQIKPSDSLARFPSCSNLPEEVLERHIPKMLVYERFLDCLTREYGSKKQHLLNQKVVEVEVLRVLRISAGAGIFKAETGGGG